MATKPEKTVKCGGIQLSVWSNETKKGIFKSITIDKSYKDEAGEWKRTKSFKPNDIPKIQLGLDEVMRYLFIKDTVQPVVEDTDI